MLTTITCLIIAISDGDTLKARCNKEQVIIRLAEIDAPERLQPSSTESKQSLVDLCLNKDVKITPQSIDRYRRIVARVDCNGKDASKEQIERGMAWVYDRYVTEPSLYNLQNNARSNRLGLWSDPTPIPPWEWRKEKRKAIQQN